VDRKSVSSTGSVVLARFGFSLLLLAAFLVQNGRAQKPAAAQPLNVDVSGFGTSFTFSPPVCASCFETELGYLYLDDGHYAPAVVTLAPAWLRGDASVLANALDSEAPHGHRVTHFGNRLDFAIRWKVLDKSGFVLTAAPWGTAFIRGVQGGRAGGVLLPQYSWGRNSVVAQFLLTGAVGVSAGNPRTDYQEAFNYTRTIGGRGYALFGGMLHEISGGDHSVGTEIGGVIPFRNGQVELACEQLTLNTEPAAQVQARVIVNWGEVLGRRH
jgi:hypothetical protein